MIWFTSDTHFGHQKVIEYSRRPFGSVEEMDAALIDNWNTHVQRRDEVWHLGDFSLRKDALARVLPKLHGTIHLVIGNHDDPKAVRAAGFASVQDVKYLRAEGHRFFLSHYAHRVWPNSDHGAIHLFGHSHGGIPGIQRSMDVGVDAVGYRPISLPEVVERLGTRSLTHHHPTGEGWVP